MIASVWASQQAVINQHIAYLLNQEGSGIGPLNGAICYALLGPGKRVRPLFTMLTAHLLGAVQDAPLNTCAAIEALHTYSLVHDDLPAMDDDDLRRGRNTCHIEYDEATAILVGDALQSLSYQWVAEDNHLNPHQKLELVKLLSRATGPSGMVGGQALDLASEGQAISVDALEHLHNLKTGALLEASVLSGAVIANENDPRIRNALSEYAGAVGLAFQIQDDILDVTSTSDQLGKAAGADADLNKATFPKLVGLEGSKKRLFELNEQAQESLVQLAPRDTRQLSQLSTLLIQRDY